jgi:hypothetical protein
VGDITTWCVLARWLGDLLHGGTRGPGFDPRGQRGYLFCNTWSRDPPGLVAGPVLRASCGTHQSGRPGAWDLPVRSARRMGPACQVGPARGTRVSGQTDTWDPRVRSDRWNLSVWRMGPTLHVRKMGPTLHIRKIDTWILHIGVNIHKGDTLVKPLRWQSNHFKYILN